MTEQQRQEEFLKAYNDLVARLGVQFTPVLQHRELGPVLQVEPGLALAPVPNWTPPKADDAPKT